MEELDDVCRDNITLIREEERDGGRDRRFRLREAIRRGNIMLALMIGMLWSESQKSQVHRLGDFNVLMRHNYK